VQCLVRQVQALRSNLPSPAEQLSIGFTLVRRQSDAPPRIRPPARAY
jgi:LacI family transcriptional regulator